MRADVIGVVRSATQLYEVCFEVDDPKDHRLPWQRARRFERRSPASHLASAWSALAAVDRWDESTLEHVLTVLRASVPALPEHADLPALHVEQPREWRPTAAHPRGHLTKVRPPKPPQPAAIDVRPYLMTRRHTDQVLEQLGERRGDPYVAWNHDVDETAAFDPWFVMRVLPLLRGATWSEVGTFALVARTFELRDDPDLFAALVAVYFEAGDPARALAWWNHVLAHEDGLLTAQLVGASGIARRDPVDVHDAAALAVLSPTQRWQCYRALANGAMPAYVLSGVALGAISSDRIEDVAAGSLDVTALVAATMERLGTAPETDSGPAFWRVHLWRMCGDQPEVIELLSSPAFATLTPTAAFQLIRLASNTRYPEETAERDWRALHPQLARIVERVASVPADYQHKLVIDLGHVYWFAVDLELDVAHAFRRCIDLAVHLAKPPFSTEPFGRSIFPLAEARAPDASWLALEGAGKRYNDGWRIFRGTYQLSLGAPSLLGATLSTAPSALIRAATALAAISAEDATRLLASYATSSIADTALADASIEHLCTVIAPIDPTAIRRALRRHLAGEITLSSAQLAGHRTRIVEQLGVLRLAAIRQMVERTLAARVGLAAIETPPLRHALEMLASTGDNRRSLRRMLAATAAGDRDWALRHPANLQWFAAHPAIPRDVWLAGYECHDDNVHIAIEHDPLEALRLGTYVGSCLGLGGGLEYSAAAVALDANKHVAYARDRHGAVIGRQLLALSDTNELVCFAVYGAAKLELEPRFRDFDRAFAAKLGIPICIADAAPIATILSRDWWNDGTWRDV